MKKAILFLLIFVLIGCDQSTEAPEPLATDANVTDSSTGTIAEIITVDSYIYIRLDQQGKEVWLASSPTAVSQNDVIRYSGEMPMKDFYSKTLDRTFPDILFVSQVELVESGGMTATAADNASRPYTNPHANLPTDPMATPEATKVQPLEDGMTISSIFSEREQKEGQEVRLRAVVTKISPNILGKNWVTLQDGTGTAPDNALIATSSETVKIGDEVIVSGIVKNDIDIGAGYKYKVILEAARFNR